MIDRTFFLDRDELSRAFGNPTIVRKFEEMQESVAASAQTSTAVIEATEKRGGRLAIKPSFEIERKILQPFNYPHSVRLRIVPGGVV